MLILWGIFPGDSKAVEDRKAGIYLQALISPIIFKGDDKTAYRDPAVLYHKNRFWLFFTLVRTESDGKVYSYTAQSESADLKTWSKPGIITPKRSKSGFFESGKCDFL